MWAKVIKRERNTRKPWVVRYDTGSGQRERSYRTRREAEAFRAQVDYQTRARIFIEPDATTALAEYGDKWLSSHVVTDGTRRTYRSVWTTSVRPVLGDKRLADIKREDIRGLLETLADRPAMARTARSVLLAMLGEAMRSERITANPASGIRLAVAKTHRAEIIWATREQLEALAAGLPEPWGLSVWLMRGLGLRVGEALGLRGADLLGDTARIPRQRLQDGSTGPLKGRIAGQYRDVPLPAYVAQMIPETPGDLFPSGRTDTYRDRFVRAAKAAGLEGYHPHQLRHTYASVLLSEGVPLFEVSRYLGHQSADFTAEVYGHLVPSAASRARAVLDGEHERTKRAAGDGFALSS